MVEAGMHEKMMRFHSLEGASDVPGRATHRVALLSRRRLARDTMAFTFEKPRNFHFMAGQHIRMTLIDPAATDTKGTSRFMSLASSPQDKKLVVVMRMSNSAFKRTLKNMSMGQHVQIQILLHAPDTAFALPPETSRPLVFLTGGIGIAPIYSMITTAFKQKRKQPMVLLYSNHQVQDAVFIKELEKLAGKHPELIVIPTYTQESVPATNNGETGRINQAMLKKYVKRPMAATYFISGMPAMVSEMKTVLAQRGIPPAQIKAEVFEGFNLNDLTQPKQSHAWLALKVLFGLVAVGVLGGHVVLAQVAYRNSAQSISLRNPITYLVGIALVVAIIVKIGVLHKIVKYGQRSRIK